MNILKDTNVSICLKLSNTNKNKVILAVKKSQRNIGVSKKEDHLVEIVIGGSTNASQLIHVQKPMEFTIAETIDNKKGKKIQLTKRCSTYDFKTKENINY